MISILHQIMFQACIQDKYSSFDIYLYQVCKNGEVERYFNCYNGEGTTVWII